MKRNINFENFLVVRGSWRQAKKTHKSKKFDDKKFSDLFYDQLESTSKKLSTFSKKIGKSIEDVEIDALVLLVEQRSILVCLTDPEEKIYFC